MNKEIEDLRRELEARGARVTRGKNHYRVRSKGKRSVFIPVTPSSHRTLANLRSLLRRTGYLER